MFVPKEGLKGFTPFGPEVEDQVLGVDELPSAYREVVFPAFVYKLLDGRGDLLYVGCSEDILKRYYSHRGTEHVWSQEIANVTYERFESLEEARRRERELIWELQPKYNVLGKAKPAA